ncbi:hypothetical protein Hanom_Chr06g00521341 [Helianthus anomalus]
MLSQFFKLTESEIEKFCSDHGIDPSLETHVPGDSTADQCSKGFLVFYTRILDQPNLLYPFTNFFLEVLKYYRLSLGQLAPVDGTKEVLEVEHVLLLRLRSYRSKLRAYPKELLVVLGISQNWVDYDFEPIFCVDRKEMSALEFILLGDPSGVEIEQREIAEGSPSIPIMDGSSSKKLSIMVRRSTRGTASPRVGPQSSDPISVDRGDEDDASVIAYVTRVKFVKKEVVLEASSGVGDAYGRKIVVVLKKLNETKRNAPKRSTQVVGSSDVKESKPVAKKKVKWGSSKPTSSRERASGEVWKEIVKSDVSTVDKEKEMGKVEEKVEEVVKEKFVVDKGKGPVKADFPVFMPQWKVLSFESTKSSAVCHDMLKNMATPAEKEALSKFSDEDAAYRVITQAARLITSLPDSIECWAACVSKDDELAASLPNKELELKASQEDLAAFQVKVKELEGKFLSSQAKMDEEMKRVEVYVGQLSDFNSQLARERAEFGLRGQSLGKSVLLMKQLRKS